MHKTASTLKKDTLHIDGEAISASLTLKGLKWGKSKGCLPCVVPTTFVLTKVVTMTKIPWNFTPHTIIHMVASIKHHTNPNLRIKIKHKRKGMNDVIIE